MITKDINGNTLGADFVTALTASDREYNARLLYDGTELDCSVDKITITKGSCGSPDGFTIGSIVGSMLSAEVRGLSTAVKGKEIEAQVGLKVNGSFVHLTLGYFTVSEAKQNVYATTITAYGASITKTGGAFTAPATRSLANIASSIASSASALAGRTVSVSFDASINTGLVIAEPMDGLTAYQALEILASVCGGYVIDTYDGNLKVCRFSDTPTLSRNNDTMLNLPVVEEENFEVTGVVVTVNEGYEEEQPDPSDPDETITVYIPPVTIPAYPTGSENLFIQNKYVTQALYTAHIATLGNYEYRPATIGLTYGDPRLEGNDVVSVTDINSEVYIVPCHMLTHTYTGGFSTQISSVNATPQADEIASSAGSLTETLSGINASAISARTSAESAKASAEEAKISANEAKEQAQTATTYANEAKTQAQTATNYANEAKNEAQSATRSANEAKASATTANKYANSALDQLGVVQDVVGVLTWASEHGSFVHTTDTTIQDGKVYFTYDSSTGDYTPVVIPQESALSTYYELTVDEAMQSFIMAHLAVTGRGLWVLPSGINTGSVTPAQGETIDDARARLGANYKTLLASDGMHVYDDAGVEVSVFGEDIRLDATRPQYIGGENAYIIFDPDNNGSITIGGSNILLGSDTPLSEVLTDVENTLIFDTTYEWNSAHTVATLTAHVYRGGVDVAQTEFAPTDFTWYLKSEDGEDPIVPAGRQDNTGYTTTVNISDCGYGAEVVAKFTPPEYATALTNDGDTLTDSNGDALQVRASGDSVRVRDLTVSTTLYDTDKLMVVGGEDEHLVTIGTLQMYLNENLDKQVYFGTTAEWNAQSSLVSQANKIYVYTDYKTDGSGRNIAGIKVGDGNAYLIDKPFIDELYFDHIQDGSIHVTASDKLRWDNAVNCYYSSGDILTFVHV